MSVSHFYLRPVSPRDYKSLAAKLAGRVKPTDLIFVRGNHWQTTPIFYYLKGDRFHFVGNHYSEAAYKRPDARIWGVTWESNYMPPAMIGALRDYRQEGERIEVWGARAVLYVRDSGPGHVLERVE